MRDGFRVFLFHGSSASKEIELHLEPSGPDNAAPGLAGNPRQRSANSVRPPTKMLVRFKAVPTTCYIGYRCHDFRGHRIFLAFAVGPPFRRIYMNGTDQCLSIQLEQTALCPTKARRTFPWSIAHTLNPVCHYVFLAPQTRRTFLGHQCLVTSGWASVTAFPDHHNKLPPGRVR